MPAPRGRGVCTEHGCTSRPCTACLNQSPFSLDSTHNSGVKRHPASETTWQAARSPAWMSGSHGCLEDTETWGPHEQRGPACRALGSDLGGPGSRLQEHSRPGPKIKVGSVHWGWRDPFLLLLLMAYGWLHGLACPHGRCRGSPGAARPPGRGLPALKSPVQVSPTPWTSPAPWPPSPAQGVRLRQSGCPEPPGVSLKIETQTATREDPEDRAVQGEEETWTQRSFEEFRQRSKDVRATEQDVGSIGKDLPRKQFGRIFEGE